MTYLIIALYLCLGFLILSLFGHALSSHKETKQRWASFGAASILAAGVVAAVILITFLVSRFS